MTCCIAPNTATYYANVISFTRTQYWRRTPVIVTDSRLQSFPLGVGLVVRNRRSDLIAFLNMPCETVLMQRTANQAAGRRLP